MRGIEELLRQHASGELNHRAPFWALLMFDAFLRNSSSARSEAVLDWRDPRRHDVTLDPNQLQNRPGRTVGCRRRW
jgi:hypothetical protein